MKIKTKAYIERDIAMLYPLLKEHGFEVSVVCIGGTCYDTLSHPESNLEIHVNFSLIKKKRRWFPWRGSWGNFDVSVKMKHGAMNSFILDQLSNHLKRTFTMYLGGRIEERRETTEPDFHHHSIDVYVYTPCSNEYAELLVGTIKSIITPK
ncbi:hypothetical protein CHH61_04025 [Shouchella clausii]|uniref:Uncharacterized protein n=1 Tax=Shouchella clausii TaxID=79880 RepID=A0A268S469_SHOCL|nr:hypothetical protein [Shouchella clausii]PAF27304.1 hypothetical protein CHH61_04025 [Shouchella clausii]